MSAQTIVTADPKIDALLEMLVDKKQIEKYQAEGSAKLAQAKSFTIESEGEYEFSLSIAEEAISRRKAKEDWMRPAKSLAHLLHRVLCAMEANATAADVEIEDYVKGIRRNWRQEQERLRAAREEEKRRIAHEAEQSAALAEAAQLEKEGEPEAAAVVVQRALEAPPPAIVEQSTVTKQAGSSIRPKFAFRIDDEDEIPREFCSSDPRKLRSHVNAYGMKANIPGVTVYPDETEAIRTKGR
jgi:hypothetical protein